MGRGASRSKSGGMTVMKDSERKIFLTNTNMSLFEFIQEGCFEKDLMSYCSNRLNDYSCIHWLDPETSSLDAFAAFSNSSLFTEDSKIFCYHDREDQSMYLMKLTQIVIPIILLIAFATSILSIFAIRKITKKLHPIATYIIYLALFDIVELIIQGGDVIIEAYFRIKVLAAIQILSRSSCQMLPFAYNLFKHSNVILYMAMAIDNWKFVKHPKQMNDAFKSEWIRNVVIVIAAVLMTLNAQFFWTFDVTENDSINLHNRTLKRTFQCSFSTTWPLKQVFTECIWPILDHLVGEVLPSLVCICCGALYFQSKRVTDKNLSKYIINLDLVYQMNQALSIISLLFGIFSLPRVFYFSFKYFYYSYLKFHKKSFRESMKFKFNMNFSRNLNSSNEEVYLQYIELFVKYTDFLFMIVKFLILIKLVGLFRVKFVQMFTFNSKGKSNFVPRKCDKCSTKDCDCSLPTIKFVHNSVERKIPSENLTLCSYTM